MYILIDEYTIAALFVIDVITGYPTLVTVKFVEYEQFDLIYEFVLTSS